MKHPLIWLHEEALRVTHPVFRTAPSSAQAVFIWDDHYFRELNYSIKRLMFIYESLCELPVDIIKGDISTVIREISPSVIYVPAASKPHISNSIAKLKSLATVNIIQDEPFAIVPHLQTFTRFFPYWKIAEKTALQKNGGIDGGNNA
jgi:hypothetical protein